MFSLERNKLVIQDDLLQIREMVCNIPVGFFSAVAGIC